MSKNQSQPVDQTSSYMNHIHQSADRVNQAQTYNSGGNYRKQPQSTNARLTSPKIWTKANDKSTQNAALSPQYSAANRTE